MKKLFKLFVALCMVSVAVVACSDDDDYSVGKYWIGYGTVEASGTQYIIKGDDGSQLHIVSNLIPQYKLTEGQRLIVNYTILGDVEQKNPQIDSKGYYVRLNGVTDVLTKGTIAQTFINKDAEHRNDSIGNTPIEVEDAWFGDRFININFEYLTNPRLGVRHMISLVRNDVALNESGEVELTLRHNGYKDVISAQNSAMIVAFGRVSFDISAVVPEGATSAKVRLIWEEYGDTPDKTVKKSSSGIFTLPSQSVQLNGRGAGSGLNISPKESDFRLDKIATLVE